MAKGFPEQQRMKAEMIARVTAGETVEDVCAGDGWPSRNTLGGWRRRDPGFRDELAQAVARGRSRRVYGWDEGKAAALLARMRAGEPLSSIWRDPEMPGRATYTRWMRSQQAFPAAVWALRRQRRADLAARTGRPFDPAMAQAIASALWRLRWMKAALASVPGSPCVHTVRRWRRERPEFDARLRITEAAWRTKPYRRGARLCTEDVIGEVIDGIAAGHSLLSLSRRPGMPSANSFYRWRRTRPDFADAVRWARELY